MSREVTVSEIKEENQDEEILVRYSATVRDSVKTHTCALALYRRKNRHNIGVIDIQKLNLSQNIYDKMYVVIFFVNDKVDRIKNISPIAIKAISELRVEMLEKFKETYNPSLIKSDALIVSNSKKALERAGFIVHASREGYLIGINPGYKES
jgi:mitochondrial fission protein ELM1